MVMAALHPRGLHTAVHLRCTLALLPWRHTDPTGLPMIPTSYWHKSWGSFVRPNSGCFDILDISCLQDPSSRRIVHLYRLDVRCMECSLVFSARDGHGLATVTGGKVVSCPACDASQAVATAELGRFVSSGLVFDQRPAGAPMAANAA